MPQILGININENEYSLIEKFALLMKEYPQKEPAFKDFLIALERGSEEYKNRIFETWYTNCLYFRGDPKLSNSSIEKFNALIEFLDKYRELAEGKALRKVFEYTMLYNDSVLKAIHEQHSLQHAFKLQEILQDSLSTLNHHLKTSKEEFNQTEFQNTLNKKGKREVSEITTMLDKIIKQIKTAKNPTVPLLKNATEQVVEIARKLEGFSKDYQTQYSKPSQPSQNFLQKMRTWFKKRSENITITPPDFKKVIDNGLQVILEIQKKLSSNLQQIESLSTGNERKPPKSSV